MITTKQDVQELIDALRSLAGRRSELETRAAAAEKRAQEARTAIADASGPAIDRLLAEAGRAEAEASTLRAAINSLATRRYKLEAELRETLLAAFEAAARQRLEESRKIEAEAQRLLDGVAAALGAAVLPLALLYRPCTITPDVEKIGSWVDAGEALHRHDPSGLRPVRLRREVAVLSGWRGDIHLSHRWGALMEAVLAGEAPVAAALRV